MPEPIEITKTLKKKYGKNFPLIEYIGDWKGRPVYYFSEFELEEYMRCVMGGSNFLLVDPDDLDNSELCPWNDPELFQFHEIAWQHHPELWHYLDRDLAEKKLQEDRESVAKAIAESIRHPK